MFVAIGTPGWEEGVMDVAISRFVLCSIVVVDYCVLQSQLLQDGVLFISEVSYTIGWVWWLIVWCCVLCTCVSLLLCLLCLLCVVVDSWTDQG